MRDCLAEKPAVDMCRQVQFATDLVMARRSALARPSQVSQCASVASVRQFGKCVLAANDAANGAWLGKSGDLSRFFLGPISGCLSCRDRQGNQYFSTIDGSAETDARHLGGTNAVGHTFCRTTMAPRSPRSETVVADVDAERRDIC
jgi:hypothetical protein